MTLEAVMRAAVDEGRLRYLDLAFGQLMLELARVPGDELLAAACLVSRRAGEGDVCLDLGAVAGRRVVDTAAGPLVCPPLPRWLKGLEGSGVVGRAGDGHPLVLEGATRLYLARYWHYESEVARQLMARCGIQTAPFDEARLADSVGRLFPAGDEVPDWQQAAAVLACVTPLAVISGGPGTGKTHTVARMLALMQRSAVGGPLRIGLAAPTGKAAARLGDAIGEARGGLPVEDTVKAAIPDGASTLHRLIGLQEGAGAHHHRDNPLHLDVLVVDEASMVDLPLMYRVLDALPATARVVLLGDRDQLASVEAGHVMGDLCHGRGGDAYGPETAARLARITGLELPRGSAGFADQVVLLRHSYRFSAAGGIGRLAAAVNGGDAAGAVAVLEDAGAEGAAWPHLDAAARYRWLADFAARHFGDLAAAGPGEALERLARARVLAALREGPWGVTELNRRLAVPLQGARSRPDDPWFPGRPVMVTRNDYDLGLYNGDLGIALAGEAGLRVWFRQADGGLRAVAPARLPAVETALAITVHKSQGSEFDEVCLVLPEQPSPVVSRELIYTGITRARRHFTLLAGGEALGRGIEERVERTSGLRERLWGNEP